MVEELAKLGKDASVELIEPWREESMART